MKHLPESIGSSRRVFLRNSLAGAAGLLVLPRLSWAAGSPNGRINFAQIGCGRMGSDDMKWTMEHSDLCRCVAVCDLDARRLEIARKSVVDFYTKQGESNIDVKAYSDYREILARKDIDAVIVSLPDHWHAQAAIEAALAGKHIYVQKPVTYNVAEAIALRKAVRASKIILQTGSQQRSSKPFPAFQPATEAVRNGRIGQVKTVKIGIGIDKPSGKKPAPMPVPAHFNYERWLGPAPEQPYMEGRVHPQDSVNGRPGWITTEDFGLGMITNWGAHHIDLMLWALGLENSGPKTVEAKATFMENDVWTVHYTYHVEMMMPNGTAVILDDKFENGLEFEGTEGSIFCSRGAVQVTASDGNAKDNKKKKKSSLRASKKSILEPLPAGAVRWMKSDSHYRNWLEAIKANRDPLAPIEQSARSLEACAAAWIGMKVGGKLNWDAQAERFVGNDAANALLSRKARKPEYDINLIMKKAGLA